METLEEGKITDEDIDQIHKGMSIVVNKLDKSLEEYIQTKKELTDLT